MRLRRIDRTVRLQISAYTNDLKWLPINVDGAAHYPAHGPQMASQRFVDDGDTR